MQKCTQLILHRPLDINSNNISKEQQLQQRICKLKLMEINIVLFANECSRIA